jgi:hypothetical protein|tara:strand:- start:227 stop:463 length:237 start_codon:yes stop_codon:yes gene_type:complete
MFLKQKIKDILTQRNINISDVSLEHLYNIGIDNIVNNVEYYYDKKYSCDSVIPNLFTSGIIDYLENKINNNEFNRNRS